MREFRATVRITGLKGADPAAVQHDLANAFRRAGIESWQLLGVEDTRLFKRRAAPARVPTPPRAADARRRASAPPVDIGATLIAGAVVFATLFFLGLMQ